MQIFHPNSAGVYAVAYVITGQQSNFYTLSGGLKSYNFTATGQSVGIGQWSPRALLEVARWQAGGRKAVVQQLIDEGEGLQGPRNRLMILLW